MNESFEIEGVDGSSCSARYPLSADTSMTCLSVNQTDGCFHFPRYLWVLTLLNKQS